VAGYPNINVTAGYFVGLPGRSFFDVRGEATLLKMLSVEQLTRARLKPRFLATVEVG